MAKGKEPKLRTRAGGKRKKYAESERKKARRTAHRPRPVRVEKKADDEEKSDDA